MKNGGAFYEMGGDWGVPAVYHLHISVKILTKIKFDDIIELYELLFIRWKKHEHITKTTISGGIFHGTGKILDADRKGA